MSTLLSADGAPTDPEVTGGDVPAVRASRRRTLRRLLVGLNVMLAVGVAALGVGVGYVYWQESRINKLSISSGDTVGVGALVDPPKGAPVNILVVGSDSRAAAKDAADRKQFGTNAKVDGQRSDTMMVIRLDPKNDRATVLSIPRDMYVDIEGGGKDRLNVAFASKADRTKSDPDRLIRTITKNFGIPINHYVEIDFFGFRDAVDAVGGVKVYFEFPSRDAFSLLDVKMSGCVQLDGDAALSYVRSRHFEYQEKGRWKSDPTSDFGRIKRQQDFIRRLVRKAVAEGLTNPLTAHRLIEAGVKNLSVDQSFDVGDMKSLASQLKNLNEGGLLFLSIPGEAVMVDGSSVLRLDRQGANEVLVAFGAPPLVTTTTGRSRGSTAATVDTGVASGTTVRVFNATTRASLATSTAKALADLGLSTATGGNKPVVATSQIRHPAGAEASAQALQRLIGGGADLAVDPALRKGDLQLVLGSSFTTVQPPAAPVTTIAPAAPLPAPPTTQPAVGSDPSKTC